MVDVQTAPGAAAWATVKPHSAGHAGNISDFSSDVGRKKFGFSHEEIDESFAYYEGQFKLYQRCGDGTLHSPESGAKYVGQFLNDKFHGEGDQIWPDGNTYTGTWKNGRKHGEGRYVTAEGLEYRGQWENGRRHGQGLQSYSNNDTYDGWWFDGLCSGSGVYQFADGSRYEGAWANGRYDGPGMMYGNDGSRERHGYSGGLLMKREVLPNARSTPGKGRQELGASRHAKVLVGQTREAMHQPTALKKQLESKYLIRRETAGMDLSAPPLKPKTAPARPYAGIEMGQRDKEAPFPDMPGPSPSTAAAQSVGTEQGLL